MNLIEFPNALEMINHSIEKQFAAKGDEIINANKNAITKALDNLVLVDKKLVVNNKATKKEKNVIETINAREGDNLPVSK